MRRSRSSRARKPGREHGPVLRDRVLVLLGAERLERVELAVLVGSADRERERGVRAAGLERLQHELLLDARRLGELGDRRRPAELDGLVLDDLRELDVELLEPARDAHRPALVAEVALDLADDVRGRVGRQLDAAVDVEAVDRLDQADAADLDEIVELLAAVGVAPGERADEREVLLDQLLARGEVALLVVAAQQRLVGLARVTSTRSPRARSPCAARPTSRRRARSAATLSTTVSSSAPQADARRPPPARARPPSRGSGPIESSIVPPSTRSTIVTSLSCSSSWLEQRVERELKIVEDVERDVVPCRDPADDEPGDGRRTAARAGC